MLSITCAIQWVKFVLKVHLCLSLTRLKHLNLLWCQPFCVDLISASYWLWCAVMISDVELIEHYLTVALTVIFELTDDPLLLRRLLQRLVLDVRSLCGLSL